MHGQGGADPTLLRGPGGAIYAAAQPGIFRVEPDKLVPTTAFSRPLSRSVHGHMLVPLYFAMKPNGALYADDTGPLGYKLRQAYVAAFRQHLVSIGNGHASLLWQEHTSQQAASMWHS